MDNLFTVTSPRRPGKRRAPTDMDRGAYFPSLRLVEAWNHDACHWTFRLWRIDLRAVLKLHLYFIVKEGMDNLCLEIYV